MSRNLKVHSLDDNTNCSISLTLNDEKDQTGIC